MAITSRNAFTRDDYNWVKRAFTVSIGTSFENYLQIVTYGLQDEQNGNGTTPSLSPQIASLLGSGTGEGTALPAYFSRRKCRDTSIGGNDAINPPFQFNEDDDISHPFTQTDYGLSGMGRVYSEVIDDNQQIMYITFGIPEFNNLSSFYRDTVVPQLAKLMNTGSANDVGYLIGSTVTTVLTLPAIPLIFINKLIGGLSNTTINKYYDFSNKMALYYRCVNSIIAHLSVNMGFANDGYMQKDTGSGSTQTGSTMSADTYLGQLRGSAQENGTGLPDTFAKFGFDIYRIICKKYMYELGTSPDQFGSTDQALRESIQGSAVSSSANGSKTASENMLNQFKGTLYDAQMFIGFRIEKGVDNSESVSNSTGESEVAQMLNAKLQAARNFSFSAMGGNISDTSNAIVDAVGGFLQGAADSVGIGSMTSILTGSGTIDIPEVWTGSSFSKSYTFTIKLRSPYGDPYSIMTSIYIPLSLLLAGALPRAIGPTSYTSPFLCRVYCRGMFAIPLGIIDSMTISRGNEEYGWTHKKLPTAIDVSFTIKDLSPAMYLAIAGSGGIGSDIASAWDKVFGENSSFQEYLMTLSGMGLSERILYLKNIRRRAKILLDIVWNKKMSPFYFGFEAGQSKLGRLLSTISPSTRLPDSEVNNVGSLF